MSVPLRPAATVLMVRDGPEGLEVLMVERASTLKFAASSLVFPGGAVDPRDDHAFLKRGLSARERRCEDLVFRIAALREAEEEVGLVLGGARRDRAIREGRDFVRAHTMRRRTLPVASLVPFAHWVTPEGAPVRFDTHFYICAAPKGQCPVPDGREVLTAQWLRPQAALDGWATDSLKLMFPTRMSLIKLARSRTAAGAIAAARREPVIRTLPILRRHGGRLIAEVSPETGHAATHSDPRDLAPEAVKRTKKA